jgi:phosphoglycolate phosphatase-like HAD superfamily hydrolase
MEGLVFLDFDGVICDSILETLVSSWRAYHMLRGESEPRAMPADLLREFTRLRPYVRAGEDFVLVQELIAAGTPIRSQDQFDAEIARRGNQSIRRYAEVFYSARRELLSSQRDYWIDLNKLYPHVLPCLIRWAPSPYLYILSTKKADYIVEILGSKGIDMDCLRVLSCRAREKNATMLRTLEERRIGRALFVDDQIDHLRSIDGGEARIVACLASWGYVQAGWLEEPGGIEVLRPDRFAERVESWLAD